MTRLRLIRLNGLLTMVIGVLIFLLALLIDLTLSGYLSSWPNALLFGVLICPFVLISLSGIYFSQYEETGKFGLAGYLLAFFGTTLTSGVLFYTFVMSVLALQDSALEQYFGPGMVLDGLADRIVLIGGVAFLLGWIAMGIATMRARLYPRWAGFLLGFGLLLGLPLRLPIPGGRSVGFAVWAVSFIVLGILQWRQKLPE